MKLLGNSSYGYQNMDRFRHTLTKYLRDERTQKAKNEIISKRLNAVKKNEVELLKSTIEHREPKVVGFFILQHAKLRSLDLYHCFFHKYCDENNLEEFKLDMDSLYLALAEDSLDDCMLPEKKAERTLIRRNDFRDEFLADANKKIFPRTCCADKKKHEKREPGFFKEAFCCREML